MHWVEHCRPLLKPNSEHVFVASRGKRRGVGTNLASEILRSSVRHILTEEEAPELYTSRLTTSLIRKSVVTNAALEEVGSLDQRYVAESMSHKPETANRYYLTLEKKRASNKGFKVMTKLMEGKPVGRRAEEKKRRPPLAAAPSFQCPPTSILLPSTCASSSPQTRSPSPPPQMSPLPSRSPSPQFPPTPCKTSKFLPHHLPGTPSKPAVYTSTDSPVKAATIPQETRRFLVDSFHANEMSRYISNG